MVDGRKRRARGKGTRCIEVGGVTAVCAGRLALAGWLTDDDRLGQLAERARPRSPLLSSLVSGLAGVWLWA